MKTIHEEWGQDHKVTVKHDSGGPFRDSEARVYIDDEFYTSRSHDGDAVKLAHELAEKNVGHSCCHIVGATLDELGLPRQCEVMTAMQKLAQNYILRTFTGRRAYARYQRIGPAIVAALRTQGVGKEVWEGILSRIRVVTELVNAGRQQEAYASYAGLVNELQSSVNA